MDTEDAFLAVIAAHPDDDGPRQVFADWLEEYGQPERAEYIRLAIQLDPDRDRFDDERINALRKRLEDLERPLWNAEQVWRETLYKPLGWGIGVEWRWGSVDSLLLPVQWLLRYGEALRRRYPVLRRLVLFRLNGWGERLAACEWLRGIRELEFPCLYGDADAAAIAASPHLGAVERVVVWRDGNLRQARLFIRGKAWPKLGNLHLVSMGWLVQPWVRAVNRAARRPLATAFDCERQLVPIAPSFGSAYGFHIGKLPNGSQLFAYGPESSPTADGWVFKPSGARLKPFRFRFPPELVLPKFSGGESRDLRQQVRAARQAHLAQATGLVPAFLRVQNFSIDAHQIGTSGPFYHHTNQGWGNEDDPEVAPEEDDPPNGRGEYYYHGVRNGDWVFNFGNKWWCDRSGRVTMT